VTAAQTTASTVEILLLAWVHKVRKSEYSNSRKWIQVGFETQLAKKPNSGLKFIAEGIISPTDNHKRDLSLLLFGFRTYQKRFSAELAMMATRFSFFEYSGNFRLIGLPYLSFTYKF
jgi:hypothetical protein